MTDKTDITTAAKSSISRRSLLKTGAAAVGAAAGTGIITGFPTIWAQTNITLRQFGTGVSNINAIAEKCKADLGITLEMTATDSDAAAQRAVTQPNSYDIADIEYWILKKVFPAGVIQPMEVKKLKYYEQIVPLFKNGKLKPDSVIAQGTAPHTVGYVEKPGDKTFAKKRSLTLGLMVMVVTVLVSLLAGLAFRRKFWGATALFYLAVASLVVPSIIISLGIGVIFQQLGIQPAWFSSAFGAHLTWTLPFGVLIMFCGV
jgi:ABC-type glycerol-3-phosphate transport system permease component